MKDNIFQGEMERILYRVTNEYKNIIVMGDLNCDMMHQKKGVPVRNICDMFDFNNTITSHTYRHKYGVSLIDVLLTNHRRKFLECGTFENTLGDGHSFIYGVLRASTPLNKQHTIYYRSFKHFNEKAFLNDLCNALFQLCVNYSKISMIAIIYFIFFLKRS